MVFTGAMTIREVARAEVGSPVRMVAICIALIVLGFWLMIKAMRKKDRDR